MKTLRCQLPGRRVLTAVLVLAAAGCSSADHRIQEKATVFAGLAPAVQAGIRRGEVGRGFTPDMAYMALGQPNLVEASADGREVTWTYLNYDTPEETAALQAKHAVSTDLTGAKGLVLGIMPNRTGYGGQVADTSSGASRPRTLADNGSLGEGDAGTNWQTVGGKADFDRGDLQIPDATVRPKTSMERVQSLERQDLKVQFLDGRVVGLELVRM